MARRRNLRIDGLKQLERNLGKLKDRVTSRQALAIALAAAKPVADKVRAEAPQGPTGNLKRSVEASAFKPRIDKPTAAFVRVSHSIAPHAHLVEFGTSHSEANPFFKRGVRRSRRAARKTLLAGFKAIVEKPYKT